MDERPAVGMPFYRGIFIGAALSMPFWLAVAYLVVRYG
jgi:hypothetical protein